MKLNPQLSDAIAIFRELGWADALPQNALTLPLGTPEQRRIALAGLRSGEWGEIGSLGNGHWGWISAIDVDDSMLGLFAVRCGVDARRAADRMPGPSVLPDALGAQVLAERGAAFAAGFVEAACKANRRPWENATTMHGGSAVRLVATLDLPVPANLEYLRDWAAFALASMTGVENYLYPRDRGAPEPALIQARLHDHLAAALSVGVPATGPFGQVVPAAVELGWLDRERAVELAFSALDAAQRPGDRKRWVDILTDDLGVTHAELVARADALVPVLATGQSALIGRLAPPLIAGVDEGLLGDVALVSLLTTSKTTLRTVLAALAARTVAAPAIIELLAPRVAELTSDRDKALARAARHLLDAWAITPVPEATSSDDALLGLWQPTPPLWTVPAFERGPATPEALADAVTAIANRSESATDIAFERFLALANAVARTDPAAARLVLRGIKGGRLEAAQAWVKGEPPVWGLDRLNQPNDRNDTVYGAAWARHFSVFQRLGQVPCLLSEPSTDDLVITLPDLVARLEAYVAVGASASEADLMLALFRLAPGVPETDARQLAVPIVLQSGETLPRTAGEVLDDYLRDPLVDPGLRVEERWRGWRCGLTEWPASLRDFPMRSRPAYWGPDPAETPGWGDAALCKLEWSSEVQHLLGLEARQIVRRATPLPPGGAINLLAIQRPTLEHVAADASLAVMEAWQRGLLVPGVADVTYLDWTTNPPSNLVTLARALREVADQGLLSVVWPVLDDLLTASQKAPRMLAGTSEIAEVMAGFVPEVLAAVRAGVAQPDVLAVPGLRLLAARSGSSQAVTLARTAVQKLPAVSLEAAPVPPRATVDLDAAWPVDAGTTPALPDGVTLEADWVDPEAPTRLIRVTLTLPDRPNERYQVAKKDWTYDLEPEGQCRADEVVGATTRNAWLHWDLNAGRLVVAPERNWAGAGNGPLENARTPLSDALVAVAVSLLVNEGDASYVGRRLIAGLAEKNLIGAASVRAGIAALLPFEAFSPAKAVMVLEKEPSLLPTLWPLLTEPIQAAGMSDGPLPRWLNRVLDVALLHADLLAAATDAGRLPADVASWPGLAEIAARPGSAAGPKNARALLGLLTAS